MTQTRTRPETAPRRARGRRAARRGLSRLQVQKISAERIKIAEAGRTSVCCGCHFVAWYPPDATVDEIVAELARWAADPAQCPPHCDPGWRWDVGEDLAVWRFGRLLAAVAHTADGVTVRRFDRGAEAAAV